MLLWLPKAPTWFSSCENISGWSSQITLYVWHWSLVIMFFWLKSFSLFISLYSESVMLTTFSNSFEGRFSSVLHDFSCWEAFFPLCCLNCLTMPFPGIMPYKCASTRGWGFNNVWIIYLIKMIIFLLWTYRNLKFVYWKCKKYPWKFH